MSFLGTLIGAESGGNPTIVNPTATSSGNASGLYQITSGTWAEFAPQAGVDLSQYPTAGQAPTDVQGQVAGLIPMSRWAPSTLNALTAAGYTVDPSATLGQNALNNGDPSLLGGGAAAALGGGSQAAAGAAGGAGSSGTTGIFSAAFWSNWFERGFLIVVGVVVVAFGLWHLMGKEKTL
jgi:hypothetical protein